MITITDKQKCCGCYACMNVCPVHCITMVKDTEGFYYPSVLTQKCIRCDKCQNICPIKNKRHIEKYQNTAIAAYAKDEIIRKKSSSGGAYYVLARSIINSGGIVYGARYSEDFKYVYHTAVTENSELERIIGSKYIQSRIDTVYLQVLDLVRNNKLVLFSGTPCQIEGLYSILGRDYDNLFTIDIVCHGVPSELIWQRYLNSSKIDNIQNVNFRDKTNGWTNYSLSVVNENSRLIIPHSQNTYMQAFIQGYTLRPSCYDCKFKGTERISDITLGDLWGASKISNIENGDTGISLLVINSKKGKQLLEKNKPFLVIQQIDLTQAIQYNSSYIKSSTMPQKRNNFFVELDNNSFSKLFRTKYNQNSIFKRIQNRIRKIIGT